MYTELSQLVHNLLLESPIPPRELAAVIGKPYSTLLREVNLYDSGAKLGVETMFQIIQKTGNTKPLEYMADKLGYKLEPLGSGSGKEDIVDYSDDYQSTGLPTSGSDKLFSS